MTNSTEERKLLNSIVLELIRNNGINPGNIVISVAGHDIHRLYLVLKCDNKMALVSDGYKKGFDNPKRKRIKHIKVLGHLNGWDSIQTKLEKLAKLEKTDNYSKCNNYILELINEFIKQ